MGRQTATTLVALAALAAASAFAQSTVAVTGGMTLAVGESALNSVGSKTEIRRQTGNLAFKGTEDIGGGLKANFVLETSIGAAADTSGAATANTLGDRGAYVSLTGGFGGVQVGNAASAVRAQFGATGDVSRISVVSGLSAGASTAPTSGSYITDAGDASARVIYGDAYSKYVAYSTPTFNGFTASVAMVPNRTNAATTATDSDSKSYSASYANGPLSVNYNLTDAATTGTGTGGTVVGGYKMNTLTASYDLGMAKVGLTSQTIKLATGVSPASGMALTVNVPVTAKDSVGAGYGKRGASASTDTRFGDNVKQSFIGYRHDLSKRTNLQVVYNKINREGATKTNDLTETHVLVGHSF